MPQSPIAFASREDGEEEGLGLGVVTGLAVVFGVVTGLGVVLGVVVV